jgi:nitrite reductase (NADH) small subunit
MSTHVNNEALHAIAHSMPSKSVVATPAPAHAVNTQWIRITSADEIPQREGRALRLGGLSVALFNTGEKFLAVENRCPHKGGPLADGIVGGTTVTCPMHNWRICLETGSVSKPCESGAPSVRTFPVKVEDGIVMLCVEPTLEEEQAA